MKYKDEYIDISEECEYVIGKYITPGHEGSILGEHELDYANVPYKRLVDEEVEVVVNDKKVTLLPLGVINDKVRRFLNHDVKTMGSRFALSSLKYLLTKDDEFKTMCYPNGLTIPSKESLKELCASYIEYYKDSLDEEWSEEDFYKMFSELNYMSLKYAIDEESAEPYVIGFFGAYERSGAGGKCLTNAELFVMPEYRGMGIARNLVGVTFDQAKDNGVNSFDSVTYHIKSQNSLAFWEKMGASVSGLIHIEGDIPEMLQVMSKDSIIKK